MATVIRSVSSTGPAWPAPSRQQTLSLRRGRERSPSFLDDVAATTVSPSPFSEVDDDASSIYGNVIPLLQGSDWPLFLDEESRDTGVRLLTPSSISVAPSPPPVPADALRLRPTPKPRPLPARPASIMSLERRPSLPPPRTAVSELLPPAPRAGSHRWWNARRQLNAACLALAFCLGGLILPSVRVPVSRAQAATPAPAPSAPAPSARAPSLPPPTAPPVVEPVASPLPPPLPSAAASLPAPVARISDAELAPPRARDRPSGRRAKAKPGASKPHAHRADPIEQGDADAFLP